MVGSCAKDGDIAVFQNATPRRIWKKTFETYLSSGKDSLLSKPEGYASTVAKRMTVGFSTARRAMDGYLCSILNISRSAAIPANTSIGERYCMTFSCKCRMKRSLDRGLRRAREQYWLAHDDQAHF
jgi:hypothetical protein